MHNNQTPRSGSSADVATGRFAFGDDCDVAKLSRAAENDGKMIAN
jgi:hypothetical protein